MAPAWAVTVHDESPITVVEIAQDVQAVVVADGQGRLRKYSRGEGIGTSGWQVRRIGHDFVMLEYIQKFDGNLLLLRVAAGEKVDLRAMSPAEENSPGPTLLPASVAVRGVEKRTRPGH